MSLNMLKLSLALGVSHVAATMLAPGNFSEVETRQNTEKSHDEYEFSYSDNDGNHKHVCDRHTNLKGVLEKFVDHLHKENEQTKKDASEENKLTAPQQAQIALVNG